VTLMTPDNLSTVLFPCLIRNPSSDLMEIMRHVEAEKTWMRKCFTSLDVSSFPTLDQCRAQAGLNGKQAPAAGNAAGDSTTAATTAAPDETACDDALPEKPHTAAPAAPPTSLPAAAVSLPGVSSSTGAPALTLDFSSLDFSNAGMNLDPGSGTDVSAILNGGDTATMDFSSVASFNFSDTSSSSGMTAPPPMLPASYSLSVNPPGDAQPSTSPGAAPQ